MNDNKVLIYQDDNGITKVAVRFFDEDIWLTQQQLAEVYDTTQQNISQHIESIYKDAELRPEATNKKFLLVRTEGNRQVRRNIDHYNLDSKAKDELLINRPLKKPRKNLKSTEPEKCGSSKAILTAP